MGLIKAGIGALGGVLADQWKDYFYCDSLDSDILVAKGEKRTDKRSSNTKGSENIISKGSVIAVNEGQCMMIVEQGKVVELCAEPGEFVFDSSTQPSIFSGDLGDSVNKSFAELGKRFTFGGSPAGDQRVYFFNTKEIVGNKYGTPAPVPFRVVDKNIGLDMDISIRCHGEYSFKIADPVLFYTNVCANVTSSFSKDIIENQLKTELMTALQPTFAKISALGIRYSALPGHTAEISHALNEVLTEKWKMLRGLEIVSFGISAVNASEEDEKMIRELQRNAAFRDPSMAAAHMVGAQAEAMQSAAKNEGGATNAFLGMNMAAQSGGVSTDKLFELGARKTEDGWLCSCGKKNDGKFCSECGKPKADEWLCSCGKKNDGKFCSECGKPKPEGEWVCSCGKKNYGKFCSECGKAR